MTVLVKALGAQSPESGAYDAEIEIDLASGWGGETGYALSLHKAGSTLMNGMIKMMCGANKAAFVSLSSMLRKRGYLPHRDVEFLPDTIPDTGVILGGFRSMPQFDLPRLEAAPKILLLRDPRDILTSHYFSVALSHNAPGAGPMRENFEAYREQGAGSDIESVALDRAGRLRDTITRYVKRLPRERLAVYHYEDVILNKSDWIADMAAHYGMRINDGLIARILNRYDIVPDREKPEDHVRQVLPGDYKRKLSPETIARLDEMFCDIYDPFHSLRRSF